MRQARIVDSIRACSSFTLVHSGPSARIAQAHGDKSSCDADGAKVRSGQIAFPCWSFYFEKLDIVGSGGQS